ncbi:MAG: diguanylate cyclase [Phycisphaeraceae bacterium]|nr:MAG: diguanylate cyclase [Phycisphaeraceae bacterium]
MNADPIHTDDSKPQVLVIDDSPDVHRLLAARLKREELELVDASTGDEGLSMAKARPPALVLLDLDMPGTDGFQVLRQLKDDAATHPVPVIVLSGLASMQDKITAFELGAVDYITKPFEFSELRVRIRSALRVHRLLQLLATRAQLDGLTGLWNRAHFDQRLAEEVSKAARHNRPLSVAIADCDHFKSVNDTFGHPAGDAVLQGVAKVLRRESRTSDVVCRYGGEEFVVLMPETAPQDAAAVCDRIRLAVEGIAWPRHPEHRVTISFGVAGTETGKSASPEAFIESADRNLYMSKRTGRNKVTSSTIDHPRPAAAA